MIRVFQTDPIVELSRFLKILSTDKRKLMMVVGLNATCGGDGMVHHGPSNCHRAGLSGPWGLAYLGNATDQAPVIDTPGRQRHPSIADGEIAHT